MSSALQFFLQVRFGDIDSYGHVNNVAYLSYLETARVHLVHTPLQGATADDAGPQAGPDTTLGDLFGPDIHPLVGRQEIEYRAPLAFRPEPIAVNVWVTRLGRSSYDLGYSVAEPDDSTVYAVASTSMVLVDRRTGSPVPISDEQRRAFEAWSGDPVDFRGRRAGQ